MVKEHRISKPTTTEKYPETPIADNGTAAFAVGAASTIALCLLILAAVFQLKGICVSNNEARFRALSTASSVGVNMGPLLENQGDFSMLEENSSDQDVQVSDFSSIPS